MSTKGLDFNFIVFQMCKVQADKVMYDIEFRNHPSLTLYGFELRGQILEPTTNKLVGMLYYDRRKISICKQISLT